MKTETLSSLFQNRKAELEHKLAHLYLPQDARRIQEAVSGTLNELLDSNGEFRQGLTQSEDYIVVSAVNLLMAQQSLSRYYADELSGMSNQGHEKAERHPDYVPVGGAAVGGAIGGIFGTWTAVIGAVVAAAITIYLKSARRTNLPVSRMPINASVFCNIIANICTNIDNLLATYRTQALKIKNSVPASVPAVPSGPLAENCAETCNDMLEMGDRLPEELRPNLEILIKNLKAFGYELNDKTLVRK